METRYVVDVDESLFYFDVEEEAQRVYDSLKSGPTEFTATAKHYIKDCKMISIYTEVLMLSYLVNNNSSSRTEKSWYILNDKIREIILREQMNLCTQSKNPPN